MIEMVDGVKDEQGVRGSHPKETVRLGDQRGPLQSLFLI
jgi:hypothetical protein